MTLKIFLDHNSFHHLKKSVPRRSRCKVLIDKAAHLKFFGSNAVITCDEIQAQNLLLYAGHHPGVVASIHKAFLLAGLSLDAGQADRLNDLSSHHPTLRFRRGRT